MIWNLVVMMKMLVQFRAGGECEREQQRRYQQTSHDWFGNLTDANFFLLRLHSGDN